MAYYISELSEILQLSCDMIRYYEKKGVIFPERDKKNNYRIYSTMDLLNLAEAIHLKRFDINIGDIAHVQNNDFTENILKHLISFKSQLSEEIKYKNMLMNRADELIARYRISKANIGNFWVKYIPGYCKYQLCFLENDHFSEITQSISVLQSLFGSAISPFSDGIIQFFDTADIWYIVVSDKYSDFLDLPTKNKIIEPARLCLCNVVDVDEIGGFSHRCYEAISEFAKKEGYQQAGEITGLLCSKGIERNGFKRYLEVRMPVEG